LCAAVKQTTICSGYISNFEEGATQGQLSGQRLSASLIDDQGGFEHLRKVRILEPYYRIPCSAVKPDYSRFSDISIGVINRIYCAEFITDKLKIDLRALNQKFLHQRNFL
jgi:hypothetical protein